VIGPQGLSGGEGEPHILCNRAGSPRLADAKAVNAARQQVRNHLLRWHHDAVDVLQRMDALTRQPVIQPHGMSARGKSLGKGQFRATLVHVLLQRLRTGHAQCLQAVGEVEALAVLIEPHQYAHVGGRHAADAQMHGVDQPVETVGGVELTVDQIVPQAGPGRLALEVQGQAEGLGKPLRGGHHHRSTIAQGHKTEVDFGFFRGIAAVDPGKRASE